MDISLTFVDKLTEAEARATPGPWSPDWTRIGGPDSYVVLADDPLVSVVARTSNAETGWRDAVLIAALRNSAHLMIALHKAARAEAATRDAMLSEVSVGAFEPDEAALVNAWAEAGVALDKALAALQDEGPFVIT